MPYETVGELMAVPDREQFVQISKIGAGYVYRKGTDYRCRDCWKFIDHGKKLGFGSCSEFGPDDKVSPKGYCINWSMEMNLEYFFPGRNALPQQSYSPEQLGYGENPRGTKCGRCKHFDGRDACEIVEGKIDKDACCNNQEPK